MNTCNDTCKYYKNCWGRGEDLIEDGEECACYEPERPHGEWKKTTHAIVCSNCGHNIEHRLFGAYMRYCCVCGSDNLREGEAE